MSKGTSLNNMTETQIGSIPSDWKVIELNQAVIYDHKSINPLEFPNEDFDYYSIPAYAQFGKPLIEVGKSILSQKLLIEHGTVLYGKLNPRVPKIWHVTARTHRRRIASTEFIPLLSREGITSDEFIYYLAMSEFLLPKSQELVSGSTPSRQRIDVRAFLEIPVPLPPLPEQRAIAHVLTTVRQSIEATERVIAAARELKRSLMKYLFTYGPVPIDQADQVVLKETEIGELPDRWGLAMVEDICSVNMKSRDPSVEHPEEYFDYIDISSVESGTGRIISPLRILGKDAPSRARREIHTDDVILSTVRPYLHAFTIVSADYDNQICSTGFAVLTCSNLASPKYLYYVSLSDLVGQQFRTRMKGASYPAINTADVKETKIPVPTIQEQIEIGNCLHILDNKIIIEIQQKSSLESLFNSLLHHLMTGKVRVKPTPNPSLQGGE